MMTKCPLNVDSPTDNLLPVEVLVYARRKRTNAKTWRTTQFDRNFHEKLSKSSG